MTERPTKSVRKGPSESLCLEFANTVAWRRSSSPEERLPSPSALVDWSLWAGLIEARQAALLHRRWRDHEKEANKVYARGVELREAIYRLFAQRSHADAVDVVNRLLADAPPRLRLASSGGTIGWAMPSSQPIELDLLTPIAWSAADLLAGPHAHRVRQCADDRGCGWLFLDQSRGGTRRWCSMGDCGNRAKARRHHLRHKNTA